MKNTFKIVAAGIVAGGLGLFGLNLYLDSQEDQRDAQKREKLMSQIIDDIVLQEYPQLTDYRDRLAKVTADYFDDRHDFIDCAKAECEMFPSDLAELTVKLGFEVLDIMKENPELLPELPPAENLPAPAPVGPYA